MDKQNQAEYWLSGPLPNITPLLQPVAHALLQAQREIHEILKDFPDAALLQTRAGVASPAFHLRHITGVLDRLFTYANGNELSEQQLDYLSNEAVKDSSATVQNLLKNLDQQVQYSIHFLENTNPETLTETRYVGRKKIASTQLGLLFHAAEHTMRHTGQLLVTVKMICDKKNVEN